MPRVLVLVGVLLVALALLPLAVLDRVRSVSSEMPRLQLIPDMDQQPYHRAQRASVFFADGRAMRPQVEGTVARGMLQEDDAYFHGQVGEDWVTTFPRGRDATTMERGRERFQIFCTPCHGDGGHGDGMIARRAERLGESKWTPPSDLTAATTRERPAGELFHIVGEGIRNMSGYGDQIPVADRWAIVAYVRALQRSANGALADVPAAQRAEIR